MKYNVLITGITGGLGTSLKHAFNKNNYIVYGHSCNEQADIQVDFTDLNSLKKIDDFIKNNNITCLVNNAGIYTDDILADISDKTIVNTINVNLTVPIIITKYFYNYITSNNKSGLVVNINSLAGKYPNYKEAIYCASKFGLNGFSSSLSINQKKSKVSIIDCYLGAIKTKMTKHRENYDGMLCPDEVAEMIVNTVNNYGNGIVSSFEYRKRVD